MTEEEQFLARADAHIALSNRQLEEARIGQVSSSMMFGTARFNAWMSAASYNSGEDMKVNKQKTLDYFIEEYKKMLNQHYDEYVENFDKYMNG